MYYIDVFVKYSNKFNLNFLKWGYFGSFDGKNEFS